ASPNLSYITFENNYINGVDLVAGAWQTDTWDNTTVIYVIEDGSVTIPAANTLTIAPGMKVKLNGTSLAVDGKFVASGTSANPVFFSSKKDDSLCGAGVAGEAICDTNNNGSSAGTARDWGNIQFNGGSDDTSTITQAIVRYGSAIRLTAASPTISSTQLVNNYRGIEALTDSTPILVCNDIHSNTNLGIYNDPPTTVVVTAKGHWWGNASGPTHTGNPGGTGQPVSDGVDYAPWLSAPCDSPPPLTYQIKGRVTEADGSPVAGVTISAGAALSAVTDSAGNYTLAGLAANPYTLTASKSGRIFLPTSQVVTVPPDKTGVNFTAQPQVDLAVTSIDLPASPVCAGSSPTFQANFRNNGATASSAFDIHWVADSQTFGSTQAGVGAEAATFYRYVWQNVSAGQHRLTFVVDPLNQISESNESNNQQTITFTAQDCTRYTITGRVTNEIGGGMSSVTISAGAGLTVVTDSNGNYTLTNLPAGGYTLTASKSGYSFTPVSRSVTVPPSATGQDFVVNVIQPPTNVQAPDGAFTDKVRVTWNASAGATYYQVYRATAPTGPKSLIGSPANLLLDDTTTAKYVTYYYFIKACNSIICSNFSSYDPGWRDGVVEGPPVDVYLIVDLTASFSDELPIFKAQASAIIAALRASNPNTRFGLGRFEDYPISPFGVASAGDKAYQRVVDLTFNAPSILNAVSSLSVRHGGDDPESQLAALYQAVSGTGQNLAGVGYPSASIPAGQQANFRREATKLILLWTDAPFHRPGEAGAIPYPGPSFSQTINAIRALGNVKVLGMVSAVRSSSLAAADTVQTQAIEPASTTSDLQEIVKGTGGVALAGVDCNGDGTPDISPGQPLVCTFTSADIEIGKAVVALVEAGRTQTKTFLPLLVK
ncbi:MAG TPA: DUF2012 domain-containing protein, partial [Anaerolineae bacterium]|nr:DUF2012 domain-containing protein [Anaerolineae bacterium]